MIDLNNDVLDRIDMNMEGKIDYEDDYVEFDCKKKECLCLFVILGVFICSGFFYLKCYIMEKSLYMGFCNLMGGSLECNGEVGIIWKNVELY